jgi:inorganic triphosphatase YgiF
MPGVTGTDELEIKLRLPRSAIGLLLRHPAVRAVKCGRASTRRLVSTYFDTAAMKLSAAGIGLRLRRDGRRWVQTVKGPAGSATGGGLSSRAEFECQLPPSASLPPLDPAHLAATPWRRKLLKATRKGLLPVFTTDYLRTALPLTLDEATHGVLCVDAGTIRARGSTRSERFCELEIELKDGDTMRLFDLALALARDLPLALEPRSKAERGFALRAPHAPAPLRAVDPPLPEQPSAAVALAAFIRASLRQIEGNADGLIADANPEWIHQMRIGTRRLRACLSLMRDQVPAPALSPVADGAKWLAGALGPARDLDVLATQTLPAVIAGIKGTADVQAAKAMRSLAARAGRLRAQARAEARAAVASPRFVGLVLGAAALAATPSLAAPADSPAASALAADAKSFARALLARRHRKLLRIGEGLPDAAPDARHAARLAAKKLRYATEFFAGLFPRKRARGYRATLMRLQDVLGTMNDAAVAVARTANIAGADSVAAATLRGYAAAHYTHYSGDLEAAWKRLEKCPAFWTE